MGDSDHLMMQRFVYKMVISWKLDHHNLTDSDLKKNNLKIIMFSRHNRFVLLVVFGFLLISSEFPDFRYKGKAALQDDGTEIAALDSGFAGERGDVALMPETPSRPSLFADAQRRR